MKSDSARQRLRRRLQYIRRYLIEYWGRAEMRYRYHAPREVTEWHTGETLGLSADLWSGDRVMYDPSPWAMLGRILDRNEVSPDDVFIDFGCGTGRIMLEAAARYPFGRVIGIDVVPRMTEISRDLIDRNRKRLLCQDVEIINEDVIEYDVPDDVTVVYMYNPFMGAIFGKVLANLIASFDRNPRRIRLIYYYMMERRMLEETGRFRFLRYGRRRLRRWDTANYVALYEITPKSQGALSP